MTIHLLLSFPQHPKENSYRQLTTYHQYTKHLSIVCLLFHLPWYDESSKKSHHTMVECLSTYTYFIISFSSITETFYYGMHSVKSDTIVVVIVVVLNE